MEKFKFNKGKKAFAKENHLEIIKGLYSNGKIIALQNDLCKSIPKIFEKADAIICILPWAKGYKAFINNSIAKDTIYKDYINGVANILKLKKPTYLVVSKEKFYEAKLKPDKIIEQIDFTEYGKGAYCNVLLFNCDKVDIKNTEELREYVVAHYNTILDFSCGYAESLRHYAKIYGSNLILADIDSDCLKEIIEKEKLICLKK